MKIVARYLWFVLGGLAIAGLAGWLLMPDPVSVETTSVLRGRFVASVDEIGRTRVRDRYVVAAPLAGRLSRIRFKVGDEVKTDESVATIYPSPAPLMDSRTRREIEERLGAAEANLERAKAVVERMRAQNDQANIDLVRARSLTQQGAATAQTLERADLAVRLAERDLRAAQFQDHAAQHEINQLRALLDRYGNGGNGQADGWQVTAPVSGVVLKVAQQSETVVQPGTALLDIGEPGNLEIVADVLSADAIEISSNADVAIEHWGGTGKLQGRVRRVEPAAFTKVSTLGIEEQRVRVVIDIMSPAGQWERLGDAYQVDVAITVFQRDDAIIIPSGALFRRDDRWNVFVTRDGRAEQRPVDLIRRSGRRAAVASGVDAGDLVVVYPSDKVIPGVRIAERKPRSP